ncbi:hypothetical protein BDV93DRAFT_528478 [Ceratobasidium sp. AG-I]|nr:hypothetical protein BDV93DRAFT_528478 [Ceratobasidium sp. AG-I]
MSAHANAALRHKLVPTKMHLPAGHRRHSLSLRIPSSHHAPLESDLLNTPSPLDTPLHSPHSPLAKRDTQTENPGAVTPVMIVGICLAAVAGVTLAVLLAVRWNRKRARTAKTMQRGIETARASTGERRQPEMAQQWRESVGGNASDDTHVVDFVYGDKVRSSFESSDYHALSNHKGVSRAAVTASVILPMPAARAYPGLKPIDVARANHPLETIHSNSPLAAPPPLFPATPSSVNSFYGPAIARARSDSSAGHGGLAATSAMRALAIAAGVTNSPTSPSFEASKETLRTEINEKEAFDLPINFSPFRASTLKLGENLGIHSESQKARTGTPEESRQSASKDEEQFQGESSIAPRPSFHNSGHQQSIDRSYHSSQTADDLARPSRDLGSMAEKELRGKLAKDLPSPGARPGTAGTFGQPVGSFGVRVPYRATHKHAASSLSIADVRSVRVSLASGLSSPGVAGGFPHHSPKPSLSHGRTESTGLASDVVARKILTVFPPLLPDELVLGLGEKVTLLQTFDDEWCVVGRDRFGEVEIGAVPAYVFTKVKTGDKMPRPMRSTSLGVQIEMSSAPGAHWSSREEVISWSNF